MSWASLFTGDTLVVADSPLESRRFGLSVARATVPFSMAGEQALPELAAVLRESAADLVVLRYPAAYADWYARLLTVGRDLVFADTLVYWRLPLADRRASEPGRLPDGLGVQVDPAIDPAELDRLVDDIFGDYANHYRANPLLDGASATAGYREWAAHSVAEDHCVTLAGPGSGVVGVATMEVTPGVAEILLAGTRSTHQGRGLYRHLLVGCVDLAIAHGAEQLVISTQGHNTGVQRAWARSGFEPVGTAVTVHAVRRGLLEAGAQPPGARSESQERSDTT
jgi:hypothetical protein